MSEAIEEGLGRAARRDWQSGTLADRMRVFLALQVERSMLMASLAGTIDVDPTPGLAAFINPSPRPGTSPERLRLVRALYRTTELLMLRQEQNLHVETSASGPDETGFVVTWPIAAIAVAVVVAGAAGIAYVANQASQILDRSLSRSEDAQRLVQRDAEVMKIIRDHQEQEQKKGQTLPLSEPSKIALQALLDQQAQIVKKRETPLDGGPFGDGSGSSLFSGVAGVAIGVGLGVLVAKSL